MTDKLSHSGTVEASDLKDSWEITLEAGKKYNWEAKNTDAHGRFNFKIDGQSLDYGDMPATESWGTIVKSSVEPNVTSKGSFTAFQSVHGLNGQNPDTQSSLEKMSFIRVSVNWILTVYKAHYSIRIYE